jgi:hypothetical protein
MDFEIAPILAVKKKFPTTRINLCFFHFSQSLWRKIQNGGFVKSYKENAKFNINFN